MLESFLLAGVNPIYTLEQAWSQTERGSQVDIAPKRGHGGCFIRGCELSARHDTQLGYEQSGDDDLPRSIINCEEGSGASAYLTCLSIEVERRRDAPKCLGIFTSVKLWIDLHQPKHGPGVSVKFPEVDSIIETTATSLARRRNAGYTRAADAIFVSMSSYLD